MSNWVTLPNGVHIDLDDPNNPLTGDGSFDSYLGGGSDNNSGKPTLLRVAGSVSEKFIRDKAEKYGQKVEMMRAGNELRVSVKGGSKLQNLVDELDEDGVLMEYPKIESKSEQKMSGKDAGFTPTKQTIWNDKNHPLYGIAPSEQDEDYLNSAIAEMSRYSNRWSTMSKSEKNEISPNGKAALDKRIKQFSKALDYIKSFK